MKSFPALHVHTYFSLLDGVPSPSKYFEKCQNLGMKKIAFTDHGSLGCLAEATIESENFDVEPIMGIEGYMILSVNDLNKKRKNKATGAEIKAANVPYHIILLAKNETGYKNLIKLNNYAWTEGFYYRSNFDYKKLFENKEGLICSSACQAGILSKHILNGNSSVAEKIARRMKREFGKDFYIELQLLDMEIQDKLNKKLIQLGNKLDIPFVLTNDVHFVNKGENEIQKILMEIASKGEFSYDAPENYLKSMKEWEKIRNERKSIPKKIFAQAIDNCFKISESCDYKVPLGNLYFPSYNHKEHFLYEKFPIEDKNEFFKKSILHRAKKILKSKFSEDVYRKRLAYEYRTLVALGAVDYFLICDDLLNYVRSEGAFSLIRGSANGSLIAFVCGFGLIDPIKHGIMFERFISKYRSLNDVDIDIDVRSEFRSKAVNYLKKKYGEDRVVSVGTYNRMQLKGAVKDVTRILKDRLKKEAINASAEEKEEIFDKQRDFEYSVINKVTSVMDGDLTIEKARKSYKVFDEWCNANSEVVEKLITPCVGTIRNVSIHPAGVVLTPNSVDELLPIRTQANPSNKSSRVISTIWENSHTSREDLNEIGVMVLDILGVKTLSVVSDTISMIKEARGEEFDLTKIDLEDTQTLNAFNSGELLGVFQFSGGSASKIVNLINITEFNDLIVINALARPGALSAGADEEFAKRKENSSLVSYTHHSLENILGDSLGVLVFSEHILRTANEFAGMHPKKADKLRKIIKGKNPTAFKKYKKEFIKGAVNKWKSEPGIEGVAEEVWEHFSQAGSYLFPRGHASSYALLGFICQYLKVHYPVEFFTCHLRHAIHEKYANIRSVANKHYGIHFNMPKANTPKLTFEPSGGAIDWPITAIKHVGDKAAQGIVKNAPFGSIKDFYDRIDRRACNSRVVETLIISGAFSDFGKKRDVLMAYREMKGKKEVEKPLPTAFLSKENMMIANEELYGFEIIPLKALYKKKIKKYGKLCSYDEFLRIGDRKLVKVFGKVIRKNTFRNRNKKMMAFLNIKNGNETFKVSLFEDSYRILGDKVQEGDVVVISGEKNTWKGDVSIVVQGDRFSGKLKPGSWINVLE